ncbi:MAG: primosomal protein N' [Gammaproteobacteria bacterium]
MARRFLRVAVFTPVRGHFDYAYPPGQATAIAPGTRVLVPFGRGTRVGIALATLARVDIPRDRIKAVREVLDGTPLLDDPMLGLAAWAADYYHCAPGEVYEALLPTELRRGQAPRRAEDTLWVLTETGRSTLQDERRLGSRQRALLALARDAPLTRGRLAAATAPARVFRECIRRGWLAERVSDEPDATCIATGAFHVLNEAQETALAHLRAGHGYRTDLLHGITGSGKTELYLYRVRDVIEAGGQALVMVPEIGLTEQLVRRFEARFGRQVGAVHSDLTERSRALVWERCRKGAIRVLLGTRSAVWMPLPCLQLIIVDEEHDTSYKQQEGFRYSARDVAVVRAHRLNIPIVLGSATPSLESLANCERSKYRYVELAVRAGGAVLPAIQVLDVRGLSLYAGLSEPLQRAILERAGRGEQSLLFLNRRGFAPIVVCHACGWIANCPRCDARFVLHRQAGVLRCHHCGTERRADSALPGHSCGALVDYTSLGVGTEQLEDALRGLFPELRALRIDRDTMSGRGRLAQAFEDVAEGRVDILVGTQMIAKGHDFARVTLVGIIDGDGGLLAADFRAEERFVQQILQVAGRAGRGARAGQVLIQSHRPDHPVFDYLRRGDYRAFARHALAERAAAELPPDTALALLRAEAAAQELPLRFLRALADALRPTLPGGVAVNGPIPALMERRIGKYRANLLLSSHDRAALGQSLDQVTRLVDALPLTRKVRWSIDVDPQEVA